MSLIDITPNGFDENNPPQQFFDVVTHFKIIAGAEIENNQVTWSPFLTFGSNNFIVTPFDSVTHVTWSVPDGYRCTFVLLESEQSVGNIYRVPHNLQIQEPGEFITINNSVPVNIVSFYGTNKIADSGGAFVLMTIALSFLLIKKFFQGKYLH